MGNIVILTGAGISAESGMGTFRDADGLWTQYSIEDVATPGGFARNPGLVHDFYNIRRIRAAEAQPNAAHRALTRLQAEWPGPVTIVTQNVDGLHEKAGSDGVLHMHGELAGALCQGCDHRWPAPPDMSVTLACPSCGAARTRPDVVWFGEIPYHMAEIAGLLDSADIFASVGTSGQVYPAAAFVQQAREAGAHTIELNLDPSDIAHDFDEVSTGLASQVVPAWVDDMLAGAAGGQAAQADPERPVT
ncbi:NAD-dependent deacylase [Marinibacterium sp. SX1]|uniref:NAD-dependent deacylase n=1 Tax=Marinibacterium sp. SX1 TaxID=3388424 RepID=UPI003D17AEC8